MSWKKDLLHNFKLMAVTDFEDGDAAILEKADQAYQGGADILQLRSKRASDSFFYQIGLKIRDLAGRHRKLFFVNDRVDLAFACKADGVHTGQNDLPIGVIRGLARENGRTIWIGRSTHSLPEATRAEKEGADYIGIGPVFQTPTKPRVKAIGLKLVQEVARAVQIPFVAIGGIDESNVEEVLEAGAKKVAVVRAIFSSGEVYESTKRLRSKIENYGK
ncbi:MAG: thiamine phosphate synthase [Candidatus Omnitrophica bacterium]|nr:thiamine phosphate synthase [Candidatus Omnitrophota bacterium]